MNNAAVDSNSYIEPDCHQTEMDFAKNFFKYVG